MSSLPCYYAPINGYASLTQQYAQRAASLNTTDSTGDAGFLGILPTMSYAQINDSFGITNGGGSQSLTNIVIPGTYDTSTGDVSLPTPAGTQIVIGTVPPLSNDQLASAGYTSFAPPSPVGNGFGGAIKAVENFFNTILSGNSLKSAFEKLSEGGPAAVGMGLSSFAAAQGSIVNGGGSSSGETQNNPAANPNLNNPANVAPNVTPTPNLPNAVSPEVNQPVNPSSPSGGFNLANAAKATGAAVYSGLSAAGSAVEGAAGAVGGQAAANFVQGFAPGGYGLPFVPQGAPAVVSTVSSFFSKIGL